MSAALLVSLLLHIITQKTKIGLRNSGEYVFSFVFTFTGETLHVKARKQSCLWYPGDFKERRPTFRVGQEAGNED